MGNHELLPIFRNAEKYHSFSDTSPDGTNEKINKTVPLQMAK